jgi:hypothetical protein
MFGYHGAGEHAAGAHEVVEECNSAGSSRSFRLPCDGSPSRIERQIIDAQDRWLRLRASSQQGPHPPQFLKREGFGQIVVGAGIQPCRPCPQW